MSVDLTTALLLICEDIMVLYHGCNLQIRLPSQVEEMRASIDIVIRNQLVPRTVPIEPGLRLSMRLGADHRMRQLTHCGVCS